MTPSRFIGFTSIVSVVLWFVACSSEPKPPSNTTPTVEAGGDAPEVVVEDENEIPCAPRRVLQTVCQQCHARPDLLNAAPFPLVHRSDILIVRDGEQVRERMIRQLETGRMPLRPATIDDASREVLLAWLKDGAPGISPTDDCSSVPADASSDGDADARMFVPADAHEDHDEIPDADTGD